MADESPVSLSLFILPGTLGICRLPAESPIPDWVRPGALMSVVYTQDEVSILCEDRLIPPGVTAERGWRGLKVEGSLDFTMVGVLASLLTPLAEANVTILAVSTFNTDYVLIKETRLDRAIQALESAGHIVVNTETGV